MVHDVVHWCCPDRLLLLLLLQVAGAHWEEECAGSSTAAILAQAQEGADTCMGFFVQFSTAVYELVRVGEAGRG